MRLLRDLSGMLTSSTQVPGLTLGMRDSTQKACASSCISLPSSFLSSFLISSYVFMSYFKKYLLLAQCDRFQTLFYVKHLLSQRYFSSSLFLELGVPRFVQASHVKDKWMHILSFSSSKVKILETIFPSIFLPGPLPNSSCWNTSVSKV